MSTEYKAPPVNDPMAQRLAMADAARGGVPQKALSERVLGEMFERIQPANMGFSRFCALVGEVQVALLSAAPAQDAATPLSAEPAQVADDVEQDAARYRWLRDEADNGEWECFDSGWLIKHDVYGQGARELDAAIDAARATAAKEPKR
jgi:hypothetical protein